MSTKQPPAPKSAPPRQARPEDLLDAIRDELTMMRRGMAGYNKSIDGWKWLQAQSSEVKTTERVAAPPIISYKGSVDGVNVEDVNVDLSKLHPDVLKAFIPGLIHHHGQETRSSCQRLIHVAQQLLGMIDASLGISQNPPPQAEEAQQEQT